VTSSAGSNGSSTTATKSCCFEPKKWATSAASTLAWAAIARSDARS
jgi:hypothetical protein